MFSGVPYYFTESYIPESCFAESYIANSCSAESCLAKSYLAKSGINRMWGLTIMSSAGARGGSGSGRLCSSGFQGQSSWAGVKPTEAEAGKYMPLGFYLRPNLYSRITVCKVLH